MIIDGCLPNRLIKCLAVSALFLQSVNSARCRNSRNSSKLQQRVLILAVSSVRWVISSITLALNMTTKAHSLIVVCFSYKKPLHASPEEGFNASHQATRVLIRAQKSPSSRSRSSVHMATSGIYPTTGVPRKGLFSSKQLRRKFPRKHHPVKILKKQVRNSRALMDLKLRATRKKSLRQYVAFMKADG